MANNEVRIDRNQACFMPARTINRWLAVRLEFLGSLLIFFTALVAFFGAHHLQQRGCGASGLDDDLHDLGLLHIGEYCLGFSFSPRYMRHRLTHKNWLIRSASDLEQNIVSVERVLGYANLPSESAQDVPDTKPLQTWPAHGAIEFE